LATGVGLSGFVGLQDFLDRDLQCAVAAGEVVFGGVLDEDAGLDGVVLHVGVRVANR
jgi:hypothetical protein